MNARALPEPTVSAPEMVLPLTNTVWFPLATDRAAPGETVSPVSEDAVAWALMAKVPPRMRKFVASRLLTVWLAEEVTENEAGMTASSAGPGTLCWGGLVPATVQL